MKRSHLILSASCLLCFVLLAGLVRSGATAPLEARVYHMVATAVSPAMTGLMRGVTALCDPLPLVAACLILLALPATRRTVGICVSASASAAVVLSTLLKHLFARERPEILRLVEEGGYSFPSSHSFTSAAIGVTLALLAVATIRRRGLRAIALALCLLYPLLVGLSRVYLGVHHGGDVVGGWLLGTAVALVATPIAQRISPWLFDPKRS